MEELLTVMGYPESDEERFLNMLGRGLLDEFPNPSRRGCPPAEVLRDIALHNMALSEAEKWLDHLTSGSPCYRDFVNSRPPIDANKSTYLGARDGHTR
jgi:hypothetical protein